jgi:hypothetical protein
MLDWAPVVVVILLLFELPGLRRWINFGSIRVTGKAATVHTLLFFVIFTLIIVVCDVHIYSGA